VRRPHSSFSQLGDNLGFPVCVTMHATLTTRGKWQICRVRACAPNTGPLHENHRRACQPTALARGGSPRRPRSKFGVPLREAKSELLDEGGRRHASSNMRDVSTALSAECVRDLIAARPDSFNRRSTEVKSSRAWCR